MGRINPWQTKHFVISFFCGSTACHSTLFFLSQSRQLGPAGDVGCRLQTNNLALNPTHFPSPFTDNPLVAFLKNLIRVRCIFRFRWFGCTTAFRHCLSPFGLRNCKRRVATNLAYAVGSPILTFRKVVRKKCRLRIKPKRWTSLSSSGWISSTCRS